MSSRDWTGLCPGRKTTEAFSFTSDEGYVLSRDSPLLMLTLITWLRNVCRLFTVTLFPPHCTLEGSCYLQHTREEWKFCSPLQCWQSLYIRYWAFFPQDICLFSPMYLFM